MNKQFEHIRVIITGGGTGGHVFPAIAIAEELKRRFQKASILFVGAEGRMEMEKVPAAGFDIRGLPVMGFQRRLTGRNIKVLYNLLRSVRKAGKIIEEFRPEIVIGVGGYASGPVLRSAARKGILTFLQEQNSYAGLTNKLLAKKAKKISVAYKDMNKYFPADKIVLTGNPVRTFRMNEKLKEEGIRYFNLDKERPVVLVVGGSLGARTINESILKGIGIFMDANLQVIWQTGKYYYEDMLSRIPIKDERIRIYAFITRMDLAYNVADLIISRAGAISISELCLVGKPCILVPSPNVAEDHQTRNARALVSENAADMIADRDAVQLLADRSVELINNKHYCEELSANIKRMARPDATKHIVDEIIKLLETER